MYNFAAFGVHHRLGPHQECKASWSVRLVPRKWHRKDALPPVTVVSANEIYYDHLWPISWLDGGFMFFQLSIFTWPGVLGAWRCFKDVHICCLLLCSNLAINVSPSYQTHSCPWHLQNKKYGYCSAIRHMKSSGHIFFCLQNPHVVYVNPRVCRKACIFTC